MLQILMKHLEVKMFLKDIQFNNNAILCKKRKQKHNVYDLAFR